MKVLFLDIDGVMNSVQSAVMYHQRNKDNSKVEWRPYKEFCPIARSNLRRILEKVPDLKVVLSSTWRMGLDHEQSNKLLQKLGVPKENCLGRTPRIWGSERGLEIEQWLKEFDPTTLMMPLIEDFVILDDDSDMGPLMSHLIQTDYRTGLSWIQVEQIIARFNGQT